MAGDEVSMGWEEEWMAVALETASSWLTVFEPIRPLRIRGQACYRSRLSHQSDA